MSNVFYLFKNNIKEKTANPLDKIENSKTSKIRHSFSDYEIMRHHESKDVY